MIYQKSKRIFLVSTSRSKNSSIKLSRENYSLRFAKLESRAFYNCPKLWEYTGVSYYESFDTEIEQDSFDADTKVIFRAGDNGILESVKAFADKNRVFMEFTDNDDYVLTDKDGTSYYDDWSEGDSRTFCVDCDDTMASSRSIQWMWEA